MNLCYRNLHRGLWSILARNGLVWKRLREVSLTNVSFVVRQGGRARALKEGRRNVHAFAKGELRAFGRKPGKAQQLRYNLVAGGFYDSQGTKWETAKRVWLDKNGTLFAV